MADSPIKNWIPYKLAHLEGQLQCYWINVLNEPFSEPFFDETISKFKGLNSKHAAFSSVSSLAMMEEWQHEITIIPPSAFIFHISRCGSTLVSQLISLIEQNIMLSEVPFLDNLLRIPYQHNTLSKQNTSNLLDAALKYYGQTRTGREQRLYIKTDSWHVFFYNVLRELYPKVPFILMYRNPAEVFNSLKKKPGMQSVQGLIEPIVFGFEPTKRVELSPDHYIATVLEKFLYQYLKIIETDSLFLLLNYDEGPATTMEKIAAFTDMPLSAPVREMIKERSRYHSKRPGEIFSEHRQDFVPECLNGAMELYYKLEEKRTQCVSN